MILRKCNVVYAEGNILKGVKLDSINVSLDLLLPASQFRQTCFTKAWNTVIRSGSHGLTFSNNSPKAEVLRCKNTAVTMKNPIFWKWVLNLLQIAPQWRLCCWMLRSGLIKTASTVTDGLINSSLNQNLMNWTYIHEGQ